MRAHDLLERAQIQIGSERVSTAMQPRRKRSAEAAFTDPNASARPSSIEMPPPFIPESQLWSNLGMPSSMGNFEPSATTSATPFYTGGTPWWQAPDIGQALPMNMHMPQHPNMGGQIPGDLLGDPNSWMLDEATQDAMYNNYFGLFRNP